MGADYYRCDNCGIGYRDDSEDACFCDCGNKFHDSKCGGLENYHVITEDEIEELSDNEDPKYQAWYNGNWRLDRDKPITCVVCRKEAANNDVLLFALLTHYGLTREQALDIWKNQKE